MRAGRGRRRLARLARGHHRSAARVRRAVPAERAAPEAGEAGEQGLGAGGAPRAVSRVSDPGRRDEAARLPVGRRRRKRGRRPGRVREVHPLGQATGRCGRPWPRTSAARRAAASCSRAGTSTSSYSTDAGSTFTSLEPDDDLRQHGGRRLLLRPDHPVRPEHRPVHLADAVQHRRQRQEPSADRGREPGVGRQQQLHVVDLLGPDDRRSRRRRRRRRTRPPGNHWLDYPNMSVGTNSLYISVDNVGNGGASPPTGGRIVVPRAAQRDPIGQHDQLPLHPLGRRRAGLRIATSPRTRATRPTGPARRTTAPCRSSTGPRARPPTRGATSA